MIIRNDIPQTSLFGRMVMKQSPEQQNRSSLRCSAYARDQDSFADSPASVLKSTVDVSACSSATSSIRTQSTSSLESEDVSRKGGDRYNCTCTVDIHALGSITDGPNAPKYVLQRQTIDVDCVVTEAADSALIDSQLVDSLIEKLTIDDNEHMKQRMSKLGEETRDSTSFISDTTESQSSSTRSVSFGEVDIRVYKSVISDHPDCSSGPALGIDWPFLTLKTVTVDEWEARRPKRTRTPLQLMMSRLQRERILKSLGYDDKDFYASVREIQRVRDRRRRTYANVGNERIELIFEKAKKTTKRLVSSKPKKIVTAY
jgi:hypothetical protein